MPPIVLKAFLPLVFLLMGTSKLPGEFVAHRTSDSVVAGGSLRTTANDDAMIKPGASVGSLKLGDNRDRARQVFPFKTDVDQESDTEACGTEYLWVDSENEQRGNVFIRFQKSEVFQIEAATTRFHTSEGIKALDSPGKVRQHYRGLKAYVLLHNSPMALGGGPLIFWVDWTKGLAFMFATERSETQRYLYSIAVFRPGGRFCPNGESTDSPDWHELRPYSLQAPKQSN